MPRIAAIPPDPNDPTARLTPVGIIEVALLLDVPTNTVHKWRTHPPVTAEAIPPSQPSTVAGGPWWWWGDILDWAVRTNRLPTDHVGSVKIGAKQ